ncbi:formate dehydrogenase accessory sulfurtransferase FdhD [Longivirga aurantiaca]|uniref:Sulfur carrier protein FdhD n=1 Tax=Longivirga aurantiaca TaxID=1837743 RepID=A0ABW1SWK3_9ACTN
MSTADLGHGDEPRARTGATASVRVLRVGGAAAGPRPDWVVVEEPLQVHLRHRGVTALLGSTMRTPGHDRELGVGLAVAEGVVRRREDVLEVRHCAGDMIRSDNDVMLVIADDVGIDGARLGRVSHPSSACGMCGRDHIDDLLAMVPPVGRDVAVSAEVLLSLPEAMSERQTVFRKTGGLHAVALATADGSVLLVREDVGRHNAVDKAVGAGLLDGVVADVLVVSGRAGFEVVQKTAMAGIPVLVAVSAPTSLAVDAARDAGLTLAAFVRGDRMTVYSGEHRITGVA